MRLGLFLLLTISILGPRPVTADALIEHARFAPPRVTMFVHVEDAAALRHDLRARPIATFGKRLLDGGAADGAWSAFARTVRVNEAALFDGLFGRRCSLFLAPGEGERGDWALVTEIAPDTARWLHRAVKPVYDLPRWGLRLGTIPEHDLRFAALGELYLIGPRRGLLFTDMAERIGGAVEAPSLADDPAFDRSRLHTAGRLGMFIRHDPFVGGWSVLSAEIEGDRVDLRHAAQFEHPPFQRQRTELEWNMAPLQALEQSAVMAVIEPTDIGGGLGATFIETELGESLLSEAMRRNLCECRIFTIGEIEGRMEPHKTDMLMPSGVLAMKVKNDETAEREIDKHVVRLVNAVNRVDEGAFLVEVPALPELRGQRYRHIDLRPATEHFGGGFPIMRSVTLNWTVARGPYGSFYVVATHPDQLRETVAALESGPPRPEQRGRWTSCGTVDGPRAARQLESYGDQAALLAVPDPQARTFLRETLRDLAALAQGVERCRWKLQRPSENEVDLSVELVLSRPVSAGPPPADD
jgi:hypothetical protein